MYQLRDYQTEAASRAVSHLRNSRSNGILILPTGSGKSLVIAEIAYRLNEPVLIMQPSKEILEQNAGKMQSYGVDGVAIYSASCGSKDIGRFTFSMIGSAIHNLDAFRKFRYVIIDECHLVNSEFGMYQKFIRAIGCKVLGLTATPYRLYSDRYYGSMLRFITRTSPRIFSTVIYYVQVKDLLRRGFLAPLNYYELPIVDTSRLIVNTTGNDYTDESVRELYAKIRYADQLENVVQRLLAAGRTSVLVFTRFTEEAIRLSERFGNASAVVTGDTPKKEREAILGAFKAKQINVVVNVGVLTTGFDFPELDTLLIARPTRSLSLWYQMVGRAIRPYPGKQGWVVDLCGTYKRFGKVEDLEIKQRIAGKYAVFGKTRQLTNVYFK